MNDAAQHRTSQGNNGNNKVNNTEQDAREPFPQSLGEEQRMPAVTNSVVS